MSDPAFSIVVPTFRRQDALRRTLSSLIGLDYDRSRYEIIVVDDGADTATADTVRGLRTAGVQLTLQSQDRRGAATARNRGARCAAGDLLLFIDDDVVVEPDHLALHVVTQHHYRDALVNARWEFAPAVLDVLRSTQFGRFRIDLERSFVDEAIGHRLEDGCVEMAMLGAWNLALRRDLFWDLQGFDEAFPVAGAEDQDFSLRARAYGCRLLLDTKIRCFHNDNRLTLRSYCGREERSAQTMPVLARKYPGEFGGTPYVRENRPISRSDHRSLVIKKALKLLLSTAPALAMLHRLTGVLEIAHIPDWIQRRIYRALLGLHLFRGFRRTW